jgi:regulator of PEP synthase PpsR (kinase-PPPase family)
MIISDATGETAERMVRAATLQFSEPVQIRLFSRVRLESELEQILEKAAETRALVVFTVVNTEERELITKLVERYNIETVDLIGALIAKLASFRRIEAVEFAVKNDDGAEPRNLPKADLVLVGISRTSKTPLSTYLAQRGLKVANVPLVLGVDPPEELAQVDDRKVFGLIVQPDMLMRIRQARLSHLGMPNDSSYGQRAHIETEIAYAREIFRKHANWPVIDVTNRAIEETAADIMRIYQERNAPPAS